ncbi:MAG TPA: hypothetical protein VK325_07140 [Pseudoxanthomonas sp.]|nr:hypothetical protein [Pseudoxanthomonas sp.]
MLGNPPWDRLKLQQVEWFAERRPAIAQQSRAADRTRMIRGLQAAGDPLWADYAAASARADTMANVARDCGAYPLLSGGDINLYSLFIERAQALVRGDGIVALLVPSGISADKGASEFFRSLSTTGRLGALFDFENRKAFFPDVHASFKFSALVFGGAARSFASTRCTGSRTCRRARSSWGRRTLPRSIPTPAPRRSSAASAMPTSPRGSTGTTRCWSIAGRSA